MLKMTRNEWALYIATVASVAGRFAERFEKPQYIAQLAHEVARATVEELRRLNKRNNGSK